CSTVGSMGPSRSARSRSDVKPGHTRSADTRSRSASPSGRSPARPATRPSRRRRARCRPRTHSTAASAGTWPRCATVFRSPRRRGRRASRCASSSGRVV
ncbi:MAG: hypothetical protein AVDCRST_MAG45-2589, partial [uncultured Solirubrobacterales bacterium]